MSRDLPPALDAAVEQPVVRPFLALHIDLPDPVRVFTGKGLLNFKGADWIGAGEVGQLDTVGEATDGSATGLKVTLFKVPADLRMDVERQATKGATMELFIGAIALTDESFATILATKLIWRGRVDQYVITDAGDTLTVEVSGESRAIDQRRPSIKRFTDEYQQRRHPGDKFFEFVPQMAEIPILWAKAEQNSPASGGGGGGPGVAPRNVRPF